MDKYPIAEHEVVARKMAEEICNQPYEMQNDMLATLYSKVRTHRMDTLEKKEYELNELRGSISQLESIFSHNPINIGVENKY